MWVDLRIWVSILLFFKLFFFKIVKWDQALLVQHELASFGQAVGLTILERTLQRVRSDIMPIK
jgi:hypothetical protein